MTPANGWNEHNAPWRASGEKICELMELWRKVFESRNGAAWLEAKNPPKKPLAGFKGFAERSSGGDFMFIRPDTGDLAVWLSAGDRFFLDAGTARIIDGMDHLAGFKSVIIENDENELELLTCKNDGFYRLKIGGGMTDRARTQFVELKNLKDLAYTPGAYCCVHDDNMLSVIACEASESRAAKFLKSFFGGSKNKDIDLMKIFYSHVDKNEIGAIEKVFSLISTDGRYFLYFINYRPAGMEPSWGFVGIQAFVIYDLIDNSAKILSGFKLTESIKRLIRPIQFSDNYIYFRSQSKEGSSDGPIECLNIENLSQNSLELNLSLFDAGFTAFAVSKKMVYAAMVDHHGKLKIISFKEKDRNDCIFFDYKINQEHGFPIDSVYFTDSGEFLITRSIDNKIVKWRTGSWDKAETLCPALPVFTKIPQYHLEWHQPLECERYYYVTAADGRKVYISTNSYTTATALSGSSTGPEAARRS